MIVSVFLHTGQILSQQSKNFVCIFFCRELCDFDVQMQMPHLNQMSYLN